MTDSKTKHTKSHVKEASHVKETVERVGKEAVKVGKEAMEATAVEAAKDAVEEAVKVAKKAKKDIDTRAKEKELGMDSYRMRLLAKRAKEGNKIVIMGATSGQGLRCAVILALAGWKVGVAGRNEKVLKRLKERWPDQIEYEKIDITKDDAPEKLKSLINKLGGMDIYFHVAGIQYINPELMLSQEIETLETEVVGFARMLVTAYHYYKGTGRKGQIAAITSAGGTRGTGPIASYSSGKKFGQTYLEALEQLAHLDKMDVAFTDIRPGWIRTPLELAELNYPINMTMKHAEPRILDAIMRRERVAIIDGRWKLFFLLWKSIPSEVWIRMKPPICSYAPKKDLVKNSELEQTKF